MLTNNYFYLIQIKNIVTEAYTEVQKVLKIITLERRRALRHISWTSVPPPSYKDQSTNFVSPEDQFLLHHVERYKPSL